MKKYLFFSCLSLILIGTSLTVEAQTSDAVSQSETSALSSPDDAFPPQPLYWEFFGGGGSFSTDSYTQAGTINYPVRQGGDLDVYATGNGSSSSFWMLGGNMGYKWPEMFPKNSSWGFAPSAELEGYYWQGTQSGTLNNQNSVVESERRFVDNAYSNQFSVSYPMHTGVFLLNAVLSAHQKDSKFRPYIGGGVGAAIVSIQGASSEQTDPAEPGVNFYSSSTDATDWTFATQAKLGVNYIISKNTSVFAEYRFLYLAPTAYIFGEANDEDFPSTTNWDVNIGSMCFNMGTVGIRYDA